MLKALRKSTLKQRDSRKEKERGQLKLIIKKKRKTSITKAKEVRRARLDILQKEIQENQIVIAEGISSNPNPSKFSGNYPRARNTL